MLSNDVRRSPTMCGCAGTEQDPDEDLMAVPDVPGQSPNQSHHGAGSRNGTAKSSAGRSDSITLNLSEVDAQTLRDYEVRLLLPHVCHFKLPSSEITCAALRRNAAEISVTFQGCMAGQCPRFCSREEMHSGMPAPWTWVSPVADKH